MEKLYTPFGETINKDLPLNDYPRPQLRRDNWQNLNGRWQYAIRKTGEERGETDGEIIVPFSPETLLSGVEKTLLPDQTLYYERTFDCLKDKRRILLHFGAVDYACTVKVNGCTIGTHKGGYTPFSFDITDKVKEGKNLLQVEVTDPTDAGTQARGKQRTKRGGIWYTPQSGIWQTVWTEQVVTNYLKDIKITPDIDRNKVTFQLKYAMTAEPATITVKEGERVICQGKGKDKITLDMGECTLWSPENPFLYDVLIETAGGDKVTSYFGMRKFGIGKDEKGVTRLTLNNKPYFQNGLLDQGYWSDGLYTAPSDEALIYDIQTMKDMGFNMLRKHIKIEPLRWYYHCDRLGMIVWQDMVSGGGVYKAVATSIVPAIDLGLCAKITKVKDDEKHYAFFSREDEEGRKEYYRDGKDMIDLLYNAVSIAVWVPFNEGWGQFDSAKAYDFFKKNDPTRIIDHASGFHDQGVGDLNSFHIYFTPFVFPKYDKKDDRPIVLSEYGGFSLSIEGHMFNKKTFGYRKFKNATAYQKAIARLLEKKVVKAIQKGVSATVYTEVSDVEDESNGLLTFDRKAVKIPIDTMKKINGKVKL